MRKVSAGIILAGFVFVFFALPFAGIDLLIDAVGFLLIFNGVRPLARLNRAFRPCPALSLGLTAVAALQLFTAGWAALCLGLLRAAGQAALCLLLGHGFCALSLPNSRPLARFTQVAFTLAALVAALGGVFQLFTLPPAFGAIAGRVFLVVQLGALAALVGTFFAKSPPPEEPPPYAL